MRFKEMNKQDQELQKTLEEYEFMPENFEIRSDRLRRVHQIDVNQYKPLFRVINFTKIADMIQLITDHGVISTEQIAKASKSKNKKKFILLSLRRQFTDQYLQRYNLQEIDCSLDKLYPDPIGYRNRERWYTIASNLLLDEFRRVELKINTRSRRLYFTDNDGERRSIDHFNEIVFIEFLMIVMRTSEIFNNRLVLSKERLLQIVTNILYKEKTFVTND